jgi:glycosyltransferase involved in cell wall biosynthesis
MVYETDLEAHQHKQKNGVPLVSVMMPVFNSQDFIRLALDSLLAQDYFNIEVIVLDNLSSDETPNICREYVERDSRVRYFCDKTPCLSHEAASRLMGYVSGDYCMLACDDDLWEPNYISHLLRILLEYDDVGMAYSRRGEVDVKGVRTMSGSPKLLLRLDNTKFKNFVLYLLLRPIVPMVFGLFRTSVYRQTLPFKVFDKTLYDADNHFLLKFLTFFKVHGVEEILFYYRTKDRSIGKEGSTDKNLRSTVPINALERFVYKAKHQLVFGKEIFKIIKQSNFPILQRVLLKIYTVSVCLFYISNMIPGANRLLSLFKKILRRVHLALNT